MKLRNLVVYLSVLSIIGPFVLIYNFYPFLRFGMFAETIISTNQTETFEIWYESQNKEEIFFSPESIGLTDGHFSSIVRNYYYQKKTRQLLCQIDQIYNKNGTLFQWKLIRKNLNNNKQKSNIYDVIILKNDECR